MVDNQGPKGLRYSIALWAMVLSVTSALFVYPWVIDVWATPQGQKLNYGTKINLLFMAWATAFTVIAGINVSVNLCHNYRKDVCPNSKQVIWFWRSLLCLPCWLRYNYGRWVVIIVALIAAVFFGALGSVISWSWRIGLASGFVALVLYGIFVPICLQLWLTSKETIDDKLQDFLGLEVTMDRPAQPSASVQSVSSDEDVLDLDQ